MTTKPNPYYDTFARWQVNKLYKLGKIKFGDGGLLVTAIPPHFAKCTWPSIQKNPQPILLALGPPASKPIDCALIKSGSYAHETIKTISDPRLSAFKMMGKAKGKKAPAASMFDPKKPKAARIYRRSLAGGMAVFGLPRIHTSRLRAMRSMQRSTNC